MTKSELITRLALRFPALTHNDVEVAANTILKAMSDQLGQGKRIEVRGFGSFNINVRPPRRGRNPKTGEQVMVPEKHVPHFKSGKELRELVNLG
jgi:integration host factor subunit beta